MNSSTFKEVKQMNIKDKIIEWQEQVKGEFCINDAEMMEIDQDL